jgi:hypothetical protein
MSNGWANFWVVGSRKSQNQGGVWFKFFFSQIMTGLDEAVCHGNVPPVSGSPYIVWTVMYGFPDTLSGQFWVRRARA